MILIATAILKRDISYRESRASSCSFICSRSEPALFSAVSGCPASSVFTAIKSNVSCPSALSFTFPGCPFARFFCFFARARAAASSSPAGSFSSYYKVVVFIVPLQGLYAILLEMLWIVFVLLPLRWF